MRRLSCEAHFAAVGVLVLFLTLTGRAVAAPAVEHVWIAPLAVKSQVPEATAQGRFLAPQAISAIDISADGRFITIGTMAFSHDANVWQFAPDGTVITKRHLPPV